LIRSFLAIELPETILKTIEDVQKDLKSSQADVRWVHPGKIHLTLKFFGDIEEARTDSIVTAIEGFVSQTKIFTLDINGIGVFPHWKNPRVVWMGVSDPDGLLIPFHKLIEEVLKGSGFEPEGRAFRPHLTLGRVNSSRGREELMKKVEPYREREFMKLPVGKITLFKSDLRPTGPVYTRLREIYLMSPS
jgi:2'-5' RNA ligase